MVPLSYALLDIPHAMNNILIISKKLVKMQGIGAIVFTCCGGGRVSFPVVSPVEVFKAQTGMDFFENHYYRFYRFLLSLAAVWPYQNARFTVLWRILYCCILCSFFVVQLLKIFTTSKGNMDSVLETLSTLITSFACFVKYLNCWINSDKIKELLERIKEDWRTTVCESEMKIIRQYTEKGRVYTISYMLMVYVGMTLVCMRLLLPDTLNAFTSLNISRFMYKPIQGEYFVNIEEHFFLIQLHINVVAFTTLTVTVAADAVFIAVTLHACAMFAVVGQRLQHTFDKDTPESCAIDKNPKAVVRILEHHKRTIEFARIINSCYKHSYVIQLFLIIIDLSIVMFHLSSVFMKMDNMEDVIITILSTVVHCGVVFLNCVPGQKLLDSSADVFRKAYHGLWYTASSRSQKILLLIMLRTMQPTGLTAANVFTMSFEMFGVIIQSSLSYFMVLYSIQTQSN